MGGNRQKAVRRGRDAHVSPEPWFGRIRGPGAPYQCQIRECLVHYLYTSIEPHSSRVWHCMPEAVAAEILRSLLLQPSH